MLKKSSEREKMEMPNRLLKEGITDSAKIDRLTPEEEVFFYRLLVIADDYGRVDARPAVLRARCFPLKESLTVSKIEGWMSSLERETLLGRYQVGSEVFAEIANWEQRVRSKGKYPPPEEGEWLTIDGNPPTVDRQMTTYDGLGKGKGKGLGLGATLAIAFDGAQFSGITPEKLSMWQKAYPAIDLETETAKAAVWLVANPKNRKSNYERFLTNWFVKSQDGAARVSRKPDDNFKGMK